MSTKAETPTQAASRLAGAAIKSGKWRSEALYEYRAANGAVLYWKVRVRLATGNKWVRPMYINGNGFELGEPRFAGGKPLYRLDELTAKPGAPIWFTEGENKVDALARLGILATTTGSATSDDGVDLSPLAGRVVVIWPDNDKPGLEYAHRIAAKLVALDCFVEIIDAVALGLKEKGDAVDWLLDHPGATAADLANLPRVAAANGAKTRANSEKLPGLAAGYSGLISDADHAAALACARARLMASAPPIEADYPSDALGPLAAPCKSIAEDAQIAPAIVGQSLLATAALLTQAIANVATLGGFKPLSLNLLSIAMSGDGKSRADEIALARVRAHQREEVAKYKRAMAQHARDLDRCKRGNTILEPPRKPFRVVRDCTIEGLRHEFADGLPSQGVFTSEAAVMLCGYGMNPENRAKTAATYAGLWDDGMLSVSRQSVGRIELYDQRLSIHWLIQPDAARSALHDPLLSGNGFWPRFLCVWPVASIPRKAKPYDAENDADVKAFYRRCDELLSRELGTECSGLMVLACDEKATARMHAFFEKCEREAKNEAGALTEVRPFAVRATEQAYRIAGVLAAFAGKDKIDEATALGAIKLVLYSLATWRSIFGDGDTAQASTDALALYGWLLRQREQSAREPAILQLVSPKRLRTRSRRDAALAVLEQNELVERIGDHWRAIIAKPSA